MLTLRLILVYALIAQLGAGYRCCPVNAECSIPTDTSTCCSSGSCCVTARSATTCCLGHSDEADENDENDQRSACPCCKEHRLGSKQPMEGVPAPELPSLSLLTMSALAPSYDQPDPDVFIIRWEARPPKPRPTIERLAQLSVWLT